MQPLTLEEQLVAARKTIAALMRRVEEGVGSGESAFASMQQTIALERIVHEKTRQLEGQAGELQQTLNELRQTQAELLHAQKLESVGRLASGIAHEINTPIQFVGDSLTFIRSGYHDLLALLDRYRAAWQRIQHGSFDNEASAVLQTAERDCDLGYLREGMPDALDRAAEGLSRVAALVSSMREFAHPEQKEKNLADINRTLMTTLTIARNEYKYVADVMTDFGDLPPIACHVGELNQVFLNIIINGAHAIEEALHGTPSRGTLRVSTRLEVSSVVIAIADTGTGIPAEIRNQIFDPFFTTKAVGKGTGQGLAIARNVVVEKHGGELTFETSIGHGTTFYIRLPVDSVQVEHPT